MHKGFLKSILGVLSLTALFLPVSAMAIKGGGVTTGYPSVLKLTILSQGYLYYCTATAFKTNSTGSSYTAITHKGCIPQSALDYPGQIDVRSQSGVSYPVSEIAFPADGNANWAILRLENPSAISSPLSTSSLAVGAAGTLVGTGLNCNVPGCNRDWRTLSAVNSQVHFYGGGHKFVQSNHSVNGPIPYSGDHGAPLFANGQISAVLSGFATSGSTVSAYHYDLQYHRSLIGYVEAGMNSLHTTCGWARTVYVNTSGARRQAFYSDGQGCYDRRYGYRYYRATLANAAWATQKSYCSSGGRGMVNSAHIQLSRRHNGSLSHIPGDPNQLIWTAEEVDSSRAYAIRLGSGLKEIHYKSEALGGVCVTLGSWANNDFSYYPAQ